MFGYLPTPAAGGILRVCGTFKNQDMAGRVDDCGEGGHEGDGKKTEIKINKTVPRMWHMKIIHAAKNLEGAEDRKIETTVSMKNPKLH